MPTSEYVNGQWITVNAAFRKYPSYKESLQDNAKVLKRLLSNLVYITTLVLGKVIPNHTKMQQLG